MHATAPDQRETHAAPASRAGVRIVKNVPGTLKIENVSKRFKIDAGEILVLDHIDLTVAPGEFVSLIGVSGCGKTTLLRLIAGLESNYEGNITIHGKRIDRPSVDRGVVFQEPRLLPWLTVEENTAFGLAGKDKRKNRQIARDHLELVGLKGFEKFYPAQLSGGMAQRAAIARALVNRPGLLLLDEPLGALDALTRIYMQKELEKIWHREKIAMVMITHDVDEAIFLGDKVVILSSKPGRIRKVIPVDLPRPRDRDNPEFIRIRDEILGEFNLQ
jgi:sulfonate transport system ATP-binding protein